MFSPKKQIRDEMRSMRKKLNPEDKRKMDDQIKRRVLLLLEKMGADTVYLYASMGQEADTWGIMEELWTKKILIALPRIEKNEIDFYYVDKKENLGPGSMNIYEPIKSCEPAEKTAAPVIVPGLAFSSQGGRIGYGGGYYDRFLIGEPEHMRIALSYDFQIKEDMELETHDQKVDCIVTPDRTIMCIGRRGK